MTRSNEPSVRENDGWTEAEADEAGEKLRQLLRGPYDPFAASSPARQGAMVLQAMRQRGFQPVATRPWTHPDDGAEWHECEIGTRQGKRVVVRAPSLDQAVAQAALEMLG